MQIRPAKPADIPAITAIYAHAVITGRASFELEPPDAAEMQRRLQTLSTGGFPYLVAEDDGALLGYAYAGPYRPRRAYRFAVENSVYVATHAQGRGVGRDLLAALIAASTVSGFRQMIAVIGDSANAASIALHRSAGFTDIGILRAIGWKHETWLDTVLMQRPLGQGEDNPPAPGA